MTLRPALPTAGQNNLAVLVLIEQDFASSLVRDHEWAENVVNSEPKREGLGHAAAISGTESAYW